MVITKPKRHKISNSLRGFASAFDLTGQTLIDLPDFSGGFEHDRQALQGDWQRIGDDMRKAMNQVANGE
jgi:hypothetical protein